MVDHRGIWTVWTAKFIFNATILLLEQYIQHCKLLCALKLMLIYKTLLNT